MFLSKRQNGIFYIHYETTDGRHLAKSTRCKRKADALKFLSGFEAEQANRNPQQEINLQRFTFEFLRRNETRYTGKSLSALKVTFKFLQKHIGNPSVSAINWNRTEKS